MIAIITDRYKALNLNFPQKAKCVSRYNVYLTEEKMDSTELRV